MEKNKKQDKVIKDALNTINEAESSYNFRVWVGAIFFHLLNRRKIPFKELQNEKYRTRNVIAGYFIVLTIVILGIYLAITLVEYLL